METGYCYEVWERLGWLDFKYSSRDHGCSLWRSIKVGWNLEHFSSVWVFRGGGWHLS